MEIKRFLVHIGPPLHNKHPIIDNIFLSYDLVEHYVFPFLQKKSNINYYKRSDYVRGSESIKLDKEIANIYCQNFINYY